ncbi:MAG TPA: RusA family crossover junction endodeoxyribonuclease [Candidatus Enterococcus avicola]|uniref:RusA family crossover junction endodeoxyribonuclease n=1 Tax=Candidatus Enterococcus avicola TaxID=2838561 RepID=A0A9D2F6I3_9ENTE|nr:RusA family crossover junction endodeoxyribonuclease [Candidatus Enterococcus avicola]
MKYTVPIAPMPQSRPRFTRQGGGRAYEKPEMTAYKKAVAYHVMAQKPKKIEKGAIWIETVFYIYPPKRILNVKKNQRMLEKEIMCVDKKPDLDNYFKAVTDAINGILYKDDGQIGAMVCRKVYSLDPRTEINVERLEVS